MGVSLTGHFMWIMVEFTVAKSDSIVIIADMPSSGFIELAGCFNVTMV